MQCGSAESSIETIIQKVLAVWLSARVKSQDSRRESGCLGMKDCFQRGSIILARERQDNGTRRDLGSRAVGRPLKPVHKAARDALQPSWKDSFRQTALIVILNPEPKSNGSVIRGFTITRHQPNGSRAQVLRPGMGSQGRARPVPCVVHFTCRRRGDHRPLCSTSFVAAWPTRRRIRPAPAVCSLLRVKGTWRREPSLYGQVFWAVLMWRGIAHPAILSHRAVVGATTVACTLLLDVVIPAKGGALRVVPGPILGPGVLAFAFVFTLLAEGVFPFPVLLQEGLENRTKVACPSRSPGTWRTVCLCPLCLLWKAP